MGRIQLFSFIQRKWPGVSGVRSKGSSLMSMIRPPGSFSAAFSHSSLQGEMDFPLIDANGIQVGLAKQEELAAFGFVLAGEQADLVLAVEKDLVGFVAHLPAGEEVFLRGRVVVGREAMN